MVMHRNELDSFIGKILTNRYLIRDLIAKGDTGKIYLAEDTAQAGMPVAVKILSPPLINQEMNRHFTRGIFISTQLGRKSNYFFKVLSYGIHNAKTAFYVMEYLPGKNLKDIIDNKPLPLSQFLSLGYQICLALQCAHQGVSVKGEIYPVIHEDIKPENIFITQDSRKQETVKIIDFGLNKFLAADYHLSINKTGVNSLPYCAPEKIATNELGDVRSDIYSLGVLMYEMLTGQKPYEVTNNSFGSWYEVHNFQTPLPFEVTSPDLNLPRELKNLVYRCLAKEPSDRPASMTEIIQTLDIIKQNSSGQKLDSSSCKRVPTFLQLVPKTSLSEAACQQKTWPKHKPIAPSVFTDLLTTTGGTVATLWAMLPKQEMEKYQSVTIGTEFLAATGYYPMLMWIMALDIANLSPRWLHSFLDLKDARGQQTVLSLAQTGYYHLLLFPLEEPNSQAEVITLTLTPIQRQKLLDLVHVTHKSHPMGLPQDSKNLLKAEYEQIKPQILRHLLGNQIKDKLSLGAWLSKSIDNCISLFSRT
ncbi:MAG: serine/threonine-protein kinase [Nostocaceae cyanobacterium]|nr:serine/threonine-protein kinase [Nostocaceae cyanobacterium]